MKPVPRYRRVVEIDVDAITDVIIVPFGFWFVILCTYGLMYHPFNEWMWFLVSVCGPLGSAWGVAYYVNRKVYYVRS